MPMEDARHFCQQRHGDLVSITSKEENVFIWKQVNIYIFNSYFLFCFINILEQAKNIRMWHTLDIIVHIYVCVSTDIQKLWALLYRFVSGS